MTTGKVQHLEPPDELAGLRRAFAAEGPAMEPCPSAETIFAGAHGDLTGAELENLLDHLALCPACSAEWRLAVEIGKERAAAQKGEVAVGAFRRRAIYRWAGVAAALLLAAVALPRLLPRQPEVPPVVRGEDEVKVVDASGRLDRNHCVLRWRLEPPREGASYAVKVTSDALEPIADRAALTATELELPAARLAPVPPGGELLWQVEATLPDGSRRLSPTFRGRLP